MSPSRLSPPLAAALALDPAIALARLSPGSDSVRAAVQRGPDYNFTKSFYLGSGSDWNGSEACASLGCGPIARNHRVGGFSDYRLATGSWRPGHTPFTSRSFA